MYTILSVPLGMQRLWKIRVGSVVVELGCCVIIGNDVEVCLLRLRQHFLPAIKYKKTIKYSDIYHDYYIAV